MKRASSLLLVLCALMIGFLCGAVLTNAYSDQVKFNYDQVVGQIGDTVITRGDLAKAIMAKGNAGMELLTHSLQEREIVFEAARRAGISVTPDELQARIDEMLKFASSTAEREKLIASRPGLDDSVRAVMLVEKMTKLTVSDEEAQAYYRLHPNLFTLPPGAQLIVIQTYSKMQADDATRMLHDGESIKDVAAACSTVEPDPAQRAQPRWYLSSEMSQPVREAIFDANDGAGLKKGEYTDVLPVQVQDPNSDKVSVKYMIMYVNDIRFAHPFSFAEARDAARYYARADKYMDVAPAWFIAQAKTLEWKQVRDLKDPQSPLEVVPIDIQRWMKSTSNNE